MKRGLFFFVVTLYCVLHCEAQSLSTRYTYWDYWETKVKCKYTVLPNGEKHGTASYYREENGKLWGTETWENNRFKGFKWLFHDGTVECEGKVIPANNSFVDNHLRCVDYKLYFIGDGNVRRLGMTSKLYKQTQSDSLSNDFVIYRRGNDSYRFALDDWRVESFSEYHSNGKIMLKFQASADRKTETITEYDVNGNIILHQIYDIANQTLTSKRYEGDNYSIKNGELILTKDVDVMTPDGTIFKYKKGSRFRNNPIQMDRDKFYESILSWAQDTQSQNFVVIVNAVGLDKIETLIMNSEEIHVNKEIAGKRFSLRIPYRKDATMGREESLFLVKTKDSLSFYSMSYVSEYNEGIEHSISATYKSDELIHLTFSDIHYDWKYYFDGDIQNNQPIGECTVEWWKYYEGGGKFVGHYSDGMWKFGTLSANGDIYEGEFDNWTYNGQGKLTRSDGKVYEGIFENGTIFSGSCTFANGDVYVGEMPNGLIRGNGILTTTNGDVYEGRFAYGVLYDGTHSTTLSNNDILVRGVSDNKYDNFGKLIKPNGDIYEGVFQEETFIPQTCTKKLENGDIFVGEIKNDVYHGHGELSKTNGDYEKGTFADGVFVAGTCKKTLENGDVYVGEIDNGEYHGHGELSKTNGDYEKGTFADGVFVAGTCKKTLENGDVYVGEIDNGEYHGHGELSKTNGDYEKGTFADGVFVAGACKKNLECGDVYVGEIDGDKYNGEGVLTMSNGDVYQGLFSLGTFVSGNVQITEKDGITYKGAYANNKYEGEGSLYFPTGDIISGTFSNGVLGRNCEIQYSNGNFYKGMVEQYQPMGIGEMTYASGNKYSGCFVNGNPDGEGTLTTSQGSTFVGTWTNNIKNGAFIVMTSDGCSYNLSYKNGEYNKKVNISFGNGDKWEGTIENQTYTKGVYTFADGVTYDGTFANGQVVKVKVRGADGKRIKNVVEYRQLNPIDKIIFE